MVYNLEQLFFLNCVFVPVFTCVVCVCVFVSDRAAYTLLGYNLEQLLSPELAASEGRACPTFIIMPTEHTSAATTGALVQQVSGSASAPVSESNVLAHTAGVVSGTPTVAATQGRRCVHTRTHTHRHTCLYTQASTHCSGFVGCIPSTCGTSGSLFLHV